jgi:hypothetical protein
MPHRKTGASLPELAIQFGQRPMDERHASVVPILERMQDRRVEHEGHDHLLRKGRHFGKGAVVTQAQVAAHPAQGSSKRRAHGDNLRQMRQVVGTHASW